jgi:nucleoside-diphosphate-sugar epimerase
LAPAALITGASGLIGAHLLERWDIADLEPVAIDRRAHDLLVPGVPTEMIESLRPQVVVHLAWSASGTPGYRSSEDNAEWLRASIELAAACAGEGVWLVATGTVLDRRADPDDRYANAKFELREAVRAQVTAGLITWVRPFYVFDLARGRPALVADALAAKASGVAVTLRSPWSKHDFVHAEDVARALLTIIRHGARGVVDVGSGEVRAVCQLVGAMGARWTATDASTAAVSHADDVADVVRLRVLGWRPDSTDALFA